MQNSTKKLLKYSIIAFISLPLISGLFGASIGLFDTDTASNQDIQSNKTIEEIATQINSEKIIKEKEKEKLRQLASQKEEQKKITEANEVERKIIEQADLIRNNLPQISEKLKGLKKILLNNYPSENDIEEINFCLNFIKDAEKIKNKLSDTETVKINQLRVECSNLSRKAFALNLQEKMLDNGLNMKVKIKGKNNTVLEITYSLMSQVWVHNIVNGQDFDKTAYSVGFEKIIFSDGYNLNWVFTKDSK